MSDFPVRCACGATYSEPGWSKLDPVGIWWTSPDLYEQRNCACGSTISIEVHESTCLGVLDRWRRDIPGRGVELHATRRGCTLRLTSPRIYAIRNDHELWVAITEGLIEITAKEREIAGGLKADG